MTLSVLSSLLLGRLEACLASLGCQFEHAYGEITCSVPAVHYLTVLQRLRSEPQLAFDQLIDLCGVDYGQYHGRSPEDPRYAVVLHLLSVQHNWRVRVQVFCPNDDSPLLPTAVGIWASANWFEREAFDLFGILFEGHPDLRRILTDYGFVGHPMRKDFPVTGHVEVRYDADKKAVIYEPVSIEPRELTPRVVRPENYGKASVTMTKTAEKITGVSSRS
jgi:NADH-quinone oxidoreductase subunit C